MRSTRFKKKKEKKKGWRRFKQISLNMSDYIHTTRTLLGQSAFKICKTTKTNHVSLLSCAVNFDFCLSSLDTKRSPHCLLSNPSATRQHREPSPVWNQEQKLKKKKKNTADLTDDDLGNLFSSDAIWGITRHDAGHYMLPKRENSCLKGKESNTAWLPFMCFWDVWHFTGTPAGLKTCASEIER